MISTEQLNAENKVIQLLYTVGFEDYGRTEIQVVTDDEGKERQFGDRKRYRLLGQRKDIRATVGLYVTCFYKVENGAATDFASFSTQNDFKKIKKAAELISQDKTISGTIIHIEVGGEWGPPPRKSS